MVLQLLTVSVFFLGPSVPIPRERTLKLQSASLDTMQKHSTSLLVQQSLQIRMLEVY